jgi:hypothetical protein
MDREIDKQEPSSSEGGQVSYAKGDKVWVECRVIEPCENLMKVTGSSELNWFWASRKQCRPVEPVIKESLTTEPNCPEIPDSSNSSEIPNSSSDSINPSHYKQGGIECIEAIKAALGEGFPDYLRGNVMKYLWRYKEKGGVDDLRKSAWYLDRLIEEVGE